MIKILKNCKKENFGSFFLYIAIKQSCSMMTCSNHSGQKSSNASEKCELCMGQGLIEIFRDDIEEYQEIRCPYCSKSKN
jgi:hypothetical protein